MGTVLHRPQPLPLARLHPDLVVVVLMLHVGLLCIANLNWPLHTAGLNAIQNTTQNSSSQIFAKAANSPATGSHSDYQVVSYVGRQRFGRSEEMLSLVLSLANGQTMVNMPLAKKAGITGLSEINANTPLQLSLTLCYVDCPPVALPEGNITAPGSHQQRLKP